MALSVSNSPTAIWEEIEQSESFLVCCMFEEAASLASSVLQHLCKTNSTESVEDVQFDDMLEASGMVLVQSLKELGRTTEILDRLKILFGSVTAIPVQVLLTGACFQISEGSCPGLQEFLEEFLGKWKYFGGKFYVLASVKLNGAHLEGYNRHSFMDVEKYLEVVEVYVVALLGMVMNNADLAISWVDKAELPEEKRQELLRRLHSLYSLKATNSSQVAETPLLAERNVLAASGKESTVSGLEGSSGASEALNLPNNYAKQATVKSFEQKGPCFWWFRMITLKFGKARLVISHGKVVLSGSLIFFIYYVLWKKRATLKG